MPGPFAATGISAARRRLLTLVPVAAFALAVRPALAATPIGEALAVSGETALQRGPDLARLTQGADLMVDDLVITRATGLARLLLSRDTLVNLGPAAQLRIDRFIASQGGVLELGGAMVFERPEGAAAEDVTIRTTFALIGVRGTKFFAGPSNGVFAVFTERGEVSVLAAGVKRILTAGQGVDIAAPGAPPGEVKSWGAVRIAAAYASVGL